MEKIPIIKNCLLCFMRKVFWLLIICISILLNNSFSDVTAQVTNKSVVSPKISETDDVTLLKSVAPFPYHWFMAKPKDVHTQQLMDKYLLSLLDWDKILLQEFKSVPGHSNMGYYGDGGNKENSVRPICYAAFVNAFLSKISTMSNLNISDSLRLRMEDDAIKALRYLVYSHVTGKGKCAGGEKWGNQWQSSLWTRSAALAGWILWDRIDQKLKIAVVRMLEYEANRSLVADLRNQLISNTGAEENAWDSNCSSLAYNMMPGHPNRNLWNNASKKYMYNSFSLESDHSDTTIGDDGKMVKEWVTTVNAYSDFSLENHGRVHIGYLKTTLCIFQENILNYELMGNNVPDAAFHHSRQVLDVLKKSMMNDASVIAWGSDDWRIVHCQAIDVLPYTVDGLFNNDGYSAYIEKTSLDKIRLLQHRNYGFYNYRRDLEWSGLAATRLINSYLLHAIVNSASPVISEDDFNRKYNNITYFPASKAVIQRTSTKFASFSWGSYIVGLTLNNDGSWQNWPRESSYIGRINGLEASKKNIVIENISHEIFENGFTVTGRIRRNTGGIVIVQDFSFTSLGDDITVYTERLSKVSGVVTTRETGLIGHEFEQDEPERILYHDKGISVVNVDGNKSFSLLSDWMNIGDKIGYVICRNGKKNLITYHTVFEKDRNCDYINLIGEEDSEWSDDWACMVTFLNQKHELTEEWAGKIDFKASGNSATCKIGSKVVTVNFGDKVSR